MENNTHFAETPPPCDACKALLPDALDKVLSPADQAWFDAHLTMCAACSESMADAQRGVAWLEVLKTPRPEPSPALLNRILAQTAGEHHGSHLVTALGALPQHGFAHQTWVIPTKHSNVIPFRSRLFSPMARMLETRLAMTAAMAFFSIALTLNLTGVRLNQLHVADLRPSNLSNTWFQATAQVHRSYDNLRVIRVLASRVDSVRDNLRVTPENQPEPKPASRPEGTSRRQSSADTTRFVTQLTLTDKQGGLA